jgi:hypothetical protein
MRWITVGLLGYVAALVVLHAVVRSGMRRRGHAAWRVRDTVGAFPLSMAGAAVMTATLVSVQCGAPSGYGWAGAVLGLLWMSFGARAYLKLTR